MTNDPVILILAAGAGSRMRGADKLLETIGGQAQLRRIAWAACATGAPVYVALPLDRPLRNGAIQDLPVQIVDVPDAASGMAASLHAGVTAVPGAPPVMLVLADLPDLTAEDLVRMLRSWAETPQMILRATARDGTPGHPVCFPPWAIAELLAVSGDTGARAVLAAHPDKVVYFALPGQRATTDLDTPESWAAWRASRGE